MASLATHFTASLFLCPLGFRRLLCSFSLYLTDPSLYRSRSWYFSQPNWKNFDFYTLLIFLPISSLSNIVIFLAISDNPAYRFSFLQQSLVIIFFWVVLILIILKENYDIFSVPDNLVFIFAAIAFLIEFYMSGRGVIGLGGWVHRILGGIAFFCSACCVYLSIKPSAFFAEFLLSSGLVLKGTWVLQVGLSLYTDLFGLKGCSKISEVNLSVGETDVKCELDEHIWRGIALLNLVFVGHVIMVIVISFTLFGVLNHCTNVMPREGSGLSVGSESMLMHPLPDLEME